jgi:hypothetical protein
MCILAHHMLQFASSSQEFQETAIIVIPTDQDLLSKYQNQGMNPR